jgi:hypothetical protein
MIKYRGGSGKKGVFCVLFVVWESTGGGSGSWEFLASASQHKIPNPWHPAGLVLLEGRGGERLGLLSAAGANYKFTNDGHFMFYEVRNELQSFAMNYSRSQ